MDGALVCSASSAITRVMAFKKGSLAYLSKTIWAICFSVSVAISPMCIDVQDMSGNGASQSITRTVAVNPNVCGHGKRCMQHCPSLC